MKTQNSWIAVCMVMAALIACSPAPDKLGKLDLVKWRNDRSACKGMRTSQIDDLKAEQEQLLGKFADEVGQLLGRPDIHQLGGRNQKYYIYFLEKGPQCDDITQPSTAQKVILRFNAVGLLSEITYQKNLPEEGQK